jgi:carboxymethylenebutenolidase
MTQLTAADGHRFHFYRADPPGAPKGAVVVLQEALGVNAYVRKVTDGFAQAGYIALAPALFDRVRPGTELGLDEASLARGIEILGQIRTEAVLADVQAAVDAAGASGKVALVGYSWGAHIAYQAANAISGLACAVGYYGGGIADEWRGKRRVPTLLHFGRRDEHIPFERVTQFRAGRPDVSVFDYPAGHGFDCEERASFSSEAAQLARERTRTFISQHVVGQPPVTLKNAGAYAQAKTDKKKKAKPAADDGMGPPPE